MPTTVRSLCVSLFSFSLGLASALPLSLLLRRALQGRAASPRQSAMSWLPSGPFDEQKLDSARLAMYSVRQSLRPRGTAAEWDVGYDLLAGQDGDGLRWTCSPSSSTANQEVIRPSGTTKGQEPQDCSSSCHCTGGEDSTHATHDRTSSTAQSSTEAPGGRRGVSNYLCSDARWATCGEGWPD